MSLLRFLVATAFVLSTSAHANPPAAQPVPTPADVQARLQRQMSMMSVMFDLRPSRHGFSETIDALTAAARKQGWPVGEAQDIQAQFKAAGQHDAKRMTLIPICPPGANERLAKASAGNAPPLACRVTVFEGKDGKIYVVRMNTANLATLMQGTPAGKVLADISQEESAVYAGIVQ